VHIFAHAVLAPLGLIVPAVFKALQGTQTRVDFQKYAAAPTSVPAIGSAFRDILFPPERHHSVASVAGFNIDFGFVVKQ